MKSSLPASDVEQFEMGVPMSREMVTEARGVMRFAGERMLGDSSGETFLFRRTHRHILHLLGAMMIESCYFSPGILYHLS